MNCRRWFRFMFGGLSVLSWALAAHGSDWQQCLPYPTFAEEDADMRLETYFVVQIREAKFVGPDVPAAVAQEIATSIQKPRIRVDDGSDVWADELRERTRDAWQQRGFFKAQVGDIEYKVLDAELNHRTISTTIHIDPGEQYRMGTLRFHTNRTLSSERLLTAFPIRPGDMFATEKIRQGMANMRKLYATGGYINFTPVPNTTIDDQHRTIDLEIDVDEGSLFRVDDIRIVGVGQRRELELLEKFPLYPADPFNPSAVEQFYRQNTNNPDPARAIQVKQKVSAHTVDVIIDFGNIAPTGLQQCPWATANETAR
jgi:outer membrane translocation and assembly module TamA